MTVPVDTLGPSEWLEAVTTAARVLEDHAAALDALGTPARTASGVGSDMAATLSAAVAEAESGRDFASVSAAMVNGARSAATGPSGRRLATLLEGMRDVLCNADQLDSQRFALGLEAGAELLTPSDDGRHPGGFTAVVAVAADAALSDLDRGSELGEVILSAAGAGIEELERGPQNDPRLAARGSVDPAAAGMLLVLDTLASIVTGEPLPSRPGPSEEQTARDSLLLYDVSCRLIPDGADVEVAASLEELMVGMAEIRTWDVGGDSWTVAVRSAVPGAVVEALVEVGRPRELRIALVEAAGGGDGLADSLVGSAG